MHVSEDGRVAGSIDRAKLAELYTSAEDDELKAHYEEVDPGIRDYVDALNPPAEETEVEAEPAPSAPAQADPKSAWVDWAVANGADQAEAEGMTKADLIAAYGG